MFRIERFVDDKNLPDVLRAVSGRVLELQVLPVVNLQVKQPTGKPGPHQQAKQQAGKSKPVLTPVAGSPTELFEKELRRRQGDRPFVAAVAKQVCVSIGRSRTSYRHYLQALTAAGLLQVIGSGRYQSYKFAPAPGHEAGDLSTPDGSAHDSVTVAGPSPGRPGDET